MDPVEQSKRDGNRITELELSLMHLQNDYESLNEVVLENVRRMGAMTKKIQRLTDQLESASDPESARSAEDEVPPHY